MSDLRAWTVEFYRAAAGVQQPTLWRWKARNDETSEALSDEGGFFTYDNAARDALETICRGRPMVISGDQLAGMVASAPSTSKEDAG